MKKIFSQTFAISLVILTILISISNASGEKTAALGHNQMVEIVGGQLSWSCIAGTFGMGILGGFAGASAGSVIPGVGTTAGGLIGAFAGALVGAATFC